jgi:hypothetical protein
MESNYSNEDFEHFIKQNADQYRMFPSERVWKGINGSLHTRKRWYGIWLSVLLLLTGGAVTWVMVAYPTSKKQTGQPLQLTTPSLVPGTTTPNQDLKSASQAISDLSPFKRIAGTGDYSTPANLSETAISLPVSAVEIELPGGAVVHQMETPDLSNTLAVTEEKSFTVLNPSSLFALPVISNETYHDKPQDHPGVIEKSPGSASAMNAAPYTIESVINSYKYRPTPKKLTWQLFVAPTVSYRKLSVNKSGGNTASTTYPFASPSSDVNSKVTHKPDLGLQIGLSAAYPVAKNLKIRGGLQFNINRYDIKAYQFNGEVATIDLNGGPGNNTISTWTYYRNYNGYKSDWLKNYYFSVSAPIGIEVNVIGNKKASVGVAGTLQPTYILNDKAYLISTDYKNYAEVPRLIRNVNLNTSFETFVNYTNGRTRWQIGPQVRYQVFSSFQNKYPVKENLFDFGLKIGLTLNE